MGWIYREGGGALKCEAWPRENVRHIFQLFFGCTASALAWLFVLSTSRCGNLIHFQPCNYFLLGKGRGLNRIRQKHIEKGGKMPKISQAIVAFQLLRLCRCVSFFLHPHYHTHRLAVFSERRSVHFVVVGTPSLAVENAPKGPLETKQD